MMDFVDESTRLPHASYDLWEEKFLTNTYTVMVVYQALLIGSDLAETFEYPDDAIAGGTQPSESLKRWCSI